MSKSLSPNAKNGPCAEGSAGLLAVDPFRSLAIHFGMLLGVDDFETLSAYHRGKTWLHNAWLHGKGVVWGLGVTVDAGAGEVRVAPGLALDALGRELHLEVPVCLDVASWFEENKDEHGLTPGNPFHAYVEIGFRACLTRQVPALLEPCEGSGQTTAYSRVAETVQLRMLPGTAPERREPPGTLPYHRLRLLFALEEPIRESGNPIASDQEVLDRRDVIQALPAANQPQAYLEAFREYAALDGIDLQPAAAEEGETYNLFPAVDPAPLVLAQINDLSVSDGGDVTLADDGVDNTVRFSHVATSTIQELLNGPRMSTLAAAADDGEAAEDEGANGGEDKDGPDVAPDAGGPRVDPESVRWAPRQVAFSTDKKLDAASVQPAAFTVTAFGEDGWTHVELTTQLRRSGKRVVVEFKEPLPTARRVRLIARGTGPSPILGANGVPLAGSPADPPATVHNGNDFVVMEERS